MHRGQISALAFCFQVSSGNATHVGYDPCPQFSDWY
jgi:hypothetical protein